MEAEIVYLWPRLIMGGNILIFVGEKTFERHGG